MQSNLNICYFFVEFAIFTLFLFGGIHRDGLGEAYDRDISFASGLETFAGGHNDPISVAFGGRKDIWENSFLPF